jgi:hypothetical protein
LLADVRGSRVVLSWWGSAHATGYNVKRAEAIGGPYAPVAAGLSPDSLTYTDSGLAPGATWYYAVSAMVGGSETADSAPVAVLANRRLDGDIIGSSGSWNDAGATKETVFDDSLRNFFDAPTGNGQWAGLDLGAPTVITQVRYCPRNAFAGRMVGGRFQGTNVPDFSSGVATLFTITAMPPDGTLTTQEISHPGAFRYVRYLSPDNGFGNVAEVAFYGLPTVSTDPVRLDVQTAGGALQLAWPADHIGWRLEIKPHASDAADWQHVAESAATNQLTLPYIATDLGAWFRLAYP